MTTLFQNKIINCLLCEQCEAQIMLSEFKMCNSQDLTEKKTREKKEF